MMCVQCEFLRLCSFLSWMALTQYLSSDCQSLSYQGHILIKSDLDHMVDYKKHSKAQTYTQLSCEDRVPWSG